jgi:hypothetical protein
VESCLVQLQGFDLEDLQPKRCKVTLPAMKGASVLVEDPLCTLTVTLAPLTGIAEAAAQVQESWPGV